MYYSRSTSSGSTRAGYYWPGTGQAQAGRGAWRAPAAAAGAVTCAGRGVVGAVARPRPSLSPAYIHTQPPHDHRDDMYNAALAMDKADWQSRGGTQQHPPPSAILLRDGGALRFIKKP